MAIVAVFREPILQGFDLRAQLARLFLLLLHQAVLLFQQALQSLDHCITVLQSLAQDPILFIQEKQSFFDRHALTLPGFTLFDKSPADLSSYSSSL